MAAILTLIQDFCGKKGLDVPTSFVVNTDSTYVQLLSICHSLVEDAADSPWQDQTKRITFTSIAAEDQGVISTLFGGGYRTLKQGSLYNVTQLIPIIGPVPDSDWNPMVALNTGPRYQYKVFQNHLHITPNLPAGNTIAAMVSTNYVIVDAGGTAKERFTVDTDIPLLPSNFFKQDLEWRWLREHGQSYAKLQAEANWLKAGLVGRDGNMPDLRLDQNPQFARPGVIVPIGNWNVV